MSTTLSSDAHILVFPYPAQGHIIPLLDLTHKLATRGLKITIVVTPKNLPIINPLLAKSPSIQTLILPFPNYPSIPPGVENVKDLPPNCSAAAIMHALGELYHPILHWFKTHPSPPTAMLSDFFLGWTHHLAGEMGIPRLVFYSSGAFVVSAFDYLWANVRQLDSPASTTVVSLTPLPNSPCFAYKHLPGMWLLYKESDPAWEFVKDGMIANNSSWGAVFNTFDEMETKYLEHVRKESGHVHVWAVGPLCLEGVGTGGRGGASLAQADDVMTWLDICPDASVVYVCFGSQVALTGHQVDALADGLEKSGVRFLWSVKVATEGGYDVPTDFDDRVAGRGVVIRGWAPQVSILNHRAVGVFLTHCGWNSVLEAIAAGVKMLTWPMKADQFLNARLLVEEMGIAITVFEGLDSVLNSSKLARILAESVGEAQPGRDRAIESGNAAVGAVKEGGSSYRDLDDLANVLRTMSLKVDMNEL